MRLGRVLLAVAITIATIHPQAHAQNGWLIIPGRSWGPVLIGATESDVLKVAGQPRHRRDTSAMQSIWEFGGWSVTLIRPTAVDVLQVSYIDVRDPSATTREGLKIGARLPDVLRIYGDVGDNLKPGLQTCLDIVINGNRDRRPVSYEEMRMLLDYLDRGIRFELSSSGTSGFHVTTITIRAPDRCKRQF